MYYPSLDPLQDKIQTVSILAQSIMFGAIHHPNDGTLVNIAKIVNNRPFIIDHRGRHNVIIFDLTNLDNQPSILQQVERKTYPRATPVGVGEPTTFIVKTHHGINMVDSVEILASPFNCLKDLHELVARQNRKTFPFA